MINNADITKCVAVLTRCGPFSNVAGRLYFDTLEDGERQELLALYSALESIEERTEELGKPEAERKKPTITPEQARQELRLIGEKFNKLTDGVADRHSKKTAAAGAMRGAGKPKAPPPAPLVGTGEP